jgi:hypothetical protein
MTSGNLPAYALYQSGSAELFVLPESGILWLTWKENVPSAVIQEVYDQLFRQMQSHQIKHILIDISRRGRASAADETWMMREFAPRLMELFRAGIYLAYLLNPQHYQELEEESPNGSMESLSQVLSINYFREEKNALDWLVAKL